MKVIIFAGGFGTRLLPLTKDTPKTLIKINNKPVIEYILAKISKLKDISKIYVSINNKFNDQFIDWIKEFKSHEKIANKIKLLNNGVCEENEKRGVLYDLKNYIPLIKQEDLFIIAGDNLFNFDLQKMIDLSKKTNKSVVAIKKIKKEKTVNFSNLEMDNKKNIVFFEEKPKNPKTNLSATACYFIKKQDLKILEEEKIENLKNLGQIVNILKDKKRIVGKNFRDFWIDIGSKEDIKIANKFFSGSKKYIGQGKY